MRSTLLALALSLAISSSAFAAADRYELDSSHATVAFLVDHIAYAKTLGQFTDVKGSFSYDSETGMVSDVSIVVATKSVQSHNKARDKHLRSKDFLNVKKHPKMTFTADSASVDANGEGVLSGTLELLGQSKNLDLPFVLNKAKKYPFGHKRFTLGVSASGSLQRSEYGMDYGVANALVGDTVDLIIEIEAIKSK